MENAVKFVSKQRKPQRKDQPAAFQQQFKISLIMAMNGKRLMIVCNVDAKMVTSNVKTVSASHLTVWTLSRLMVNVVRYVRICLQPFQMMMRMTTFSSNTTISYQSMRGFFCQSSSSQLFACFVAVAGIIMSSRGCHVDVTINLPPPQIVVTNTPPSNNPKRQ